MRRANLVSIERMSDLAFGAATVAALNAAAAELQTAQTQLATGRRVNQPSDDPSAFGQASVLTTMKSSLEEEINQANTAASRLNVISGALEHAANAIQQAIQIAESAANGTNNPQNLADFGKAVEGIMEAMVGLGNTKDGNVYVFSGEATDTPPFTASGAYLGSSGANVVDFFNQASVKTTLAGSAVFGDSGAGTGIMSALQSLLSALNAGDQAGVRGAIPALTGALNQIGAVQASVGASIQVVESVSSAAATQSQQVDSKISILTDADIARVSADAALAGAKEQALIAIASQSRQISLVNILA